LWPNMSLATRGHKDRKEIHSAIIGRGKTLPVVVAIRARGSRDACMSAGARAWSAAWEPVLRVQAAPFARDDG